MTDFTKDLPKDAGSKSFAGYVTADGLNWYMPSQIVGVDGVTPISSTNRFPVDVSFPSKQNISVADALPTGSNIIGTVKLSDGTNALVVDANGALKYVPYDSAGAELFTADNPGETVTTLKGSNVKDSEALPIRSLKNNIILYQGLGISVTAGSSAYLKIGIDITDFRKVYLNAKAETNHDYDIVCMWWAPDFSASVNSQFTSDKSNSLDTSNGYNNGYSAVLPPVDVKMTQGSVRLNNNDTLDHSYDVYAGGLK